jgi:soluble lytic murein transglycosylase
VAVRLASVAALVLAVACEHADSGVARGQAATDSAAASPAVTASPAAAAAAAAIWLARARAQPEIASWLYLRAAGETPDSAARRALYTRVRLPLARERVPWVEAATRERFGDTLGALRAYSALPAPVTVFRIRAALAPNALDSVRTALLAFIASTPGNDAAREGTSLFDRLFPDPTPAEQLTIARAAAQARMWSRARAGFSASSDSGLSAQDRLSFATVLARTGADARAAAEYAMVKSPAALAAAAQYQGALALLDAGDGGAARTALRTLGSTASDTSAAAALALLADLQTDDRDDAGSRATLLDLVKRFPATRFASPARFDAALIALILADPAAAAREFAALATADPDYALSAGYWLGRAHLAAGDGAAADAAWRAVLLRDSTSYYASLAAARLGTKSMSAPSSAPAAFPRVASVDSALRRVLLLRRFGMSPEAQMENDRLYREAAADSGARLLATAAAFSGTDQAARAIALGRTALVRFGSTPNVLRLLYPVAARDTIVAESRRAGLDPALVAALIRQESSFNPRATSPAGARGLMQVMPAVGQSIAPAAGITSWNPALLYDPGINIEIGIRHLAPLLRSQPDVARSLAAYNAGGSRVTRWSAKRGADDPEIFTERIPFPETRDYVKSVLRNREFYRALYAW